MSDDAEQEKVSVNIPAPEAVEDEEYDKPNEEHEETVETVAESMKKGGVYRRLSAEEYGRAKAMWLSGDYTLKEISKEIKVSTNALYIRFKKDGIMKGAGQDIHQRAAQKMVAEQLAAELRKHAESASSTRNRALQGVEVISKLRGNIIASQVKSGQAISGIYDDIKTLNEAAKGMRNDWDAVKFILDLDKDHGDEDELPKLTFRAMNDVDIKRLNDEKKAEMEELDMLDIEEPPSSKDTIAVIKN